MKFAVWIFSVAMAFQVHVAADEVANPLYMPWKGSPGKTVTINRIENIYGGAPMPGGGARILPPKPVTYTLTSLDSSGATLKVTTSPNQPAETLFIPSSLSSDDPSLPKPSGTEDLKISDKTYHCTKYTYLSTSKAELGRDPQGFSAHVTVWIADEVPGGIVRRQIGLTIRVSYDITDTLALK